jgi:acylphosphatase
MRVYTVKGRVQGVWFRDSTRREALKLNIIGYAKNLANGDVEVLAVGEVAALDSLCRWLNEGPPLARVGEVREESVRPAEPLLSGASFKIA